MPEQFEALKVVRRTGQEMLRNASEPTQFSLLDFWQWSCSDLVNNTLRGRFAEYIVACALGLNSGVRVEWDAHDLLCVDEVSIEVKSAAYLQSWNQPNYSKISFDIAPKLWWDAAKAVSSKVCERPSDMYVFCLLHHQDKTTIDPLDLSQWTFYVLKTAVLNERLPKQKQIALSSLIKLSPRICTFGELRATIEMEP